MERMKAVKNGENQLGKVIIKPLVWKQDEETKHYFSDHFWIEKFKDKFYLFTQTTHKKCDSLKKAQDAAYKLHCEFINNSIEYFEKDFDKANIGDRLVWASESTEYFTKDKVYEVVGLDEKTNDFDNYNYRWWWVIDDEEHEHHWDDKGAFENGFRKVE